MKVDTYMCTNCYMPKIFKPNDKSDHICEKCGRKMEFWCTEEIDSNTGKTINNEINNNEHIDIKKIVTGKPTIHCPTCQSTNVSKIGTLNRMVSVGLFGLASGKIGKTHKCNDCGSMW